MFLQLKQAVQRTHSAPIKSSQFGVGLSTRPGSCLNFSLEFCSHQPRSLDSIPHQEIFHTDSINVLFLLLSGKKYFLKPPPPKKKKKKKKEKEKSFALAKEIACLRVHLHPKDPPPCPVVLQTPHLPNSDTAAPCACSTLQVLIGES